MYKKDYTFLPLRKGLREAGARVLWSEGLLQPGQDGIRHGGHAQERAQPGGHNLRCSAELWRLLWGLQACSGVFVCCLSRREHEAVQAGPGAGDGGGEAGGRRDTLHPPTHQEQRRPYHYPGAGLC